MSIQTIVNTAAKINIDRRRVVGQTVSRSQRIKTSERASAQPWKLTVTPAPVYTWDTARTMVEYIMTADRNTEVNVQLSDNPKMSFLTEYTGKMTPSQLSALTITNFTGTTMTVGGLPSISSSTIMFQAGDFIQPINSRYPYVVTQPVVRGTSSTIVLSTNRPRITSEATTVTGHVLVGTATSFVCVITQLPTYEFGQHNRVNFTGDFELVEKIV